MTEIKGIEITDIFGISKLFETVSRGLGLLYEPHHKRKMAQASAEEIKVIDQAINQTTGFPITYENGKISVDSEYNTELLERTFSRMFYQEMVKQENIDTIVHHAVIELSEVDNKEEISTDEVETDWALRFINSIEDVSDPDMQKIWGKILAGETKQPGTYNLRTLNILKNISRKEAETFEKISQFILTTPHNNKFILKSTSEETEKKYNIEYRDLLLLEECGLMNSNRINLRMTLNNNYDSIIYNSNIVFRMFDLGYGYKDHETKEIIFDVYKVTDAGIELFRALHLKSNDNYAIDIFKEIKKENTQKFGEKFEASAYPIISTDKNEEVHYDTSIDLLN